MRVRLVQWLGILTVALTAPVCAAEMDAKQIRIAAKVFNYLTNKPPNQALVLVMPGAADVDTVKTALGGMTVVAGGSGNTEQAFAVFVNSADDAKAVNLGNAKILTIGGDVGCVDSGQCVIAIQTQPRVTIYSSQVAAAKAGVMFEPNFKMLMTER